MLINKEDSYSGFRHIGVVNNDTATVYVAFDLLEETYEAGGSAVRAAGDKPNDDIGLMLAYGRALQSLGVKIEKLANGRVKHRDDIRQDRRRKQEKNLNRSKEVAKTEDELMIWGIPF